MVHVHARSRHVFALLLLMALPTTTSPFISSAWNGVKTTISHHKQKLIWGAIGGFVLYNILPPFTNAGRVKDAEWRYDQLDHKLTDRFSVLLTTKDMIDNFLVYSLGLSPHNENKTTLEGALTSYLDDVKHEHPDALPYKSLEQELTILIDTTTTLQDGLEKEFTALTDRLNGTVLDEDDDLALHERLDVVQQAYFNNLAPRATYMIRATNSAVKTLRSLYAIVTNAPAYEQEHDAYPVMLWWHGKGAAWSTPLERPLHYHHLMHKVSEPTRTSALDEEEEQQECPLLIAPDVLTMLNALLKDDEEADTEQHDLVRAIPQTWKI